MAVMHRVRIGYECGIHRLHAGYVLAIRLLCTGRALVVYPPGVSYGLVTHSWYIFSTELPHDQLISNRQPVHNQYTADA